VTQAYLLRSTAPVSINAEQVILSVAGDAAAASGRVRGEGRVHA
jgi:hypothetical protein